MPALNALLVAAIVSLLVGAILYMAIRQPLQRLLVQACPGDAAVGFWSRFTLVMLFLAPLFVCIAIGLPSAEMTPKLDPATVISRIITSSLSGGFLTMLCMGAWVKSLASRYPQLAPKGKLDPEERWGTK